MIIIISLICVSISFLNQFINLQLFYLYLYHHFQNSTAILNLYLIKSKIIIFF